MLEYILLATCIVLQFTCIILSVQAKSAAGRAETAFARLVLSLLKLNAKLDKLEAQIKAEAEKPSDNAPMEPTEQERIEAGIANILAYGEAQMRKRPGDIT